LSECLNTYLTVALYRVTIKEIYAFNVIKTVGVVDT
jgi:hypothetical protein